MGPAKGDDLGDGPGWLFKKGAFDTRRTKRSPSDEKMAIAN